MHDGNVLVTGASGQIGRILYGNLELRCDHKVVASDIVPLHEVEYFETLDITDSAKLDEIITLHDIKYIYHMAAILSAKGEKDPKKAWDINMNGLLNVLNASVQHKIRGVFFPSSIAVFGNDYDRSNTSQHSLLVPRTTYGITKAAGELWCQYYFDNFGLDVRSLRYPGIIGYSTLPGGGTTDYAVHIYHEAIKHGRYTCYLESDAVLPMMYMDDAIQGTLKLMQADKERIKIRTSYNIQGMSFSPDDLAKEIKKHMPHFEMSYDVDYRQEYAKYWPERLIDTNAKVDWGWQSETNLAQLTEIMLENIMQNNYHV